MTARPDKLRFYFDESALGVGKALTIARQDCVHAGHPLIPEVPPSTLDPDWMPAVARRELVCIGRDKKIRSKPAELEAFYDHGLRAFWIAVRKDIGSWDHLVRLVRRWDDMERTIEARGPGPWFCAITDGGVTEIPFPRSRQKTGPRNAWQSP